MVKVPGEMEKLPLEALALEAIASGDAAAATGQRQHDGKSNGRSSRAGSTGDTQAGERGKRKRRLCFRSACFSAGAFLCPGIRGLEQVFRAFLANRRFLLRTRNAGLPPGPRALLAQHYPLYRFRPSSSHNSYPATTLLKL